MRNRRTVVVGVAQGLSLAERRSAANDDVVASSTRRVVALDRRERLAQFAAQLRRHAPSVRSTASLLSGLALRARNRIAGLAVRRIERDDVVAAEAGNRSREQGLQAPPLADLPRHIRE